MKKSVMLMAGLLTVALAGSAQAVTMFAVQDTNAVDKMVVDSTGFIGVGTNTPTTGIQIVGLPGNAAQLQNRTNGQDNSLGGGGFMSYHNNATLNGTLPVLNDRLGYFFFGSIDGGTARNAAGIAAKAEENWVTGGAGVGKQGAFFTFETTTVGTSGRTEKMRISSNGNIGIGSTAPTAKLHVVGLGTYNDNAAAITGGLTAGAFYLCGPAAVAPASQHLCIVY